MSSLIVRLTVAIQDRMWQLYERWQDEKAHEDFDEYNAALERAVNAIDGCTFIAATSRPFAFTWIGEDGITRRTKIEGMTILTETV